jgi:hypothetical protein
MPAYTPEIYRRLATPVELNLGSTATSVEHTRIVVDQIKQDTDAVASVSTRVDDVVTKVDALANQATTLDGRLIDTRVDLDNARKVLEAKIQVAQDKVDNVTTKLQIAISATADNIVQRVIAGVHRPASSVNEKSAPLVRLLIQAQALALDETPDERDKKFPDRLKNDISIEKLGEAAEKRDGELAAAHNDLQARFRTAFVPFGSTSLPDRAKRFADMHALISEIAAFLNKP